MSSGGGVLPLGNRNGFPRKLGNNGPRVVSVRRIWNPQQGARTELVWEGDEDALNAIAAVGMTSGESSSEVAQYNGPVYRLTQVLGDAQDGSQERPLDKWELDTEWAELSIWSNPKVLAAALTTAGGDQGLADVILSQWRTNVEKAFAANKDLNQSGFEGAEASIYLEVLRGTRAYEQKRPILSRVRTISVGYAGQINIEGIETIYVTADLVAAFAIPLAIAARLPKDPVYTASNRRWGWKERKETSEFILAINKVEEVKDWIFAPWSTVLYRFSDDA